MLDNTCISVCVIHILYVFHIIVYVLRCHDLPRSLPSRYCHVIFVMKPSVELTDVVPEIGTEFYCISSLVRFVLFRVGHRIGFCPSISVFRCTLLFHTYLILRDQMMA